MWKTSKILLENFCLLGLKENINRETESRQIATQNKVVRTNYIEAKIDKT